MDPDVCGCGVPDVDDDKDGVMNCVEEKPAPEQQRPLQPPTGPTQIAHEAAPVIEGEQGPPSDEAVEEEVEEPAQEPAQPPPQEPTTEPEVEQATE